jgi:hypothetical protein
MFAVVEWLDFQPPSVSIVPSNWLIEDDKLYSYWPPGTASDSVIKRRSEPQSNWPKFLVRLLGKAGMQYYSYMMTYLCKVCVDIIGVNLHLTLMGYDCES